MNFLGTKGCVFFKVPNAPIIFQGVRVNSRVEAAHLLMVELSNSRGKANQVSTWMALNFSSRWFQPISKI